MTTRASETSYGPSWLPPKLPVVPQVVLGAIAPQIRGGSGGGSPPGGGGAGEAAASPTGGLGGGSPPEPCAGSLGGRRPPNGGVRGCGSPPGKTPCGLTNNRRVKTSGRISLGSVSRGNRPIKLGVIRKNPDAGMHFIHVFVLISPFIILPLPPSHPSYPSYPNLFRMHVAPSHLGFGP